MVARPVRDAGGDRHHDRADQRRCARRQRRQPSSRPARLRGQLAAVAGAGTRSAGRRRRHRGEQPVVRRGSGDRPRRSRQRRRVGTCSPRRSPRCGRSGPASRSPASTCRRPRRWRSRTARRYRRSSSGRRAATRSASAASTPTASTCCPRAISPSESPSPAATRSGNRSRSAPSSPLDVDHPLGGDPAPLEALGIDRRTLYVGAPYPVDAVAALATKLAEWNPAND